MGLRQQLRNWQLVRAAWQAVSAAVALARIDRFPPVPGTADQVVALPGKFHQVMAMGKIAQPQQLWDWNIIGAWQAGTALAAELMPQPTLTLLLKVSENPFLLQIQWTVAGCERSSQFEVCGALGSHSECADASCKQKAIGQLQRLERTAVSYQQLTRCLQSTTLVSRRNRKYAHGSR